MAEMAKNGRSKPKSAKKETLPYVIAFVVCEKVLTEPDHVVSAIRIVDTVSLLRGAGIRTGM
jgi:hypothetical protein